jgi:ABC-type multidrug transport system fused ATPase/permease subunit
VLLGGHDLRAIPLSQLRAATAGVSQDVVLFHGTIEDNVRLVRPEAADAAVRDAVRRARVDVLAARLPDGLATVVGERGAALSGGEGQRVAIARALLKDAPVLVLDESVSQLDALREREVQRALERARARRTTLVTAHRLSTVLSADRVIVLDDGAVADADTHAELHDRSPVYRRLVQVQMDAAHDLAAGLA